MSCHPLEVLHLRFVSVSVKVTTWQEGALSDINDVGDSSTSIIKESVSERCDLPLKGVNR